MTQIKTDFQTLQGETYDKIIQKHVHHANITGRLACDLTELQTDISPYKMVNYKPFIMAAHWSYRTRHSQNVSTQTLSPLPKSKKSTPG